MRWIERIAVFAFLLLGATAWAQNISATIVGTVTDPTGAAVVGVPVTLTNTDTNVVVRTVKTGPNGDYSAPLLPIGHYSVSVEAPGFSKWTQKDIELNVNDKRTVNAKLQISTTSAEVVVEAEPQQVELQSATAGNLISGTQIRELALTSRNYEQLVSLVPGVSSTATTDQLYVGALSPIGTNVVRFGINGGRTTQNNWTVDGFDNVDRGSNLTLLVFPSVDAISEFKVLRGQYEAEFGRAGGGQVSVVTRSGTSQFHGNVYEFFRNDVLNANAFFNNRVTPAIPRPKLRYNNFGWTLGGPVYIPNVYNEKRNKTFFFFSQEFRRVIAPTNPVSTVPTANERVGIFAHQVCLVTTTGCPAASRTTMIPATMFSPTAQAYLKDLWSKVGLPNDSTDPHLLHTTLNSVANFREEVLKIDHVFGPKLTVSGKILRDAVPTQEPGGLFTGLGLPGIASTTSSSPGHNYNINATATLSPRLLVTAGYGYSYGAIFSHVVGLLNSATSPDIHPLLPFTNTQGRVPNITISGGTGFATFGPYDDRNINHTAYGNATRIFGAHTFKAGITYYHYRKRENNGGGPQGSFSFNNSGIPANPGTGASTFEQSWANFLLGHSSSFSQSNIDTVADIRLNQIEMYGQDEYRILPNLTLTYGVRYSLFRQPTDAHGLLSNFDPRAYDPAKAPCIAANGNIDPTCTQIGSTAGTPNYDPLNGIIFQGKNPFYGSKVSTEDNSDFAPRIGLVWDPFKDGKTAIRAGYGLFYDAITVSNFETNIFNNPPTTQTLSIPNTSFDNPGAGTPTANIPKRVRSLDPTPYHTPYTEQYSLDIQHDMGRGFLLDLGYYGSQAHHLIGQIDINQPLPNAYRTQIQQCPSPTVNTNCVQPGAYITSATTPLLNRIRPYRGYVGIDGNRSMFNSNYHSLQFQLQKKLGANSLVNVVYTFSKALTDNQSDISTAPQNSYCPRTCEYGLAQTDRPHILTANFVYELPFLKDQRGLTGHVLGGWETSGIFTIESGIPSTVTTLASQDPTGQGCLGPSPCSVRPDEIRDPNNGAPQSFDQWFDKTAYQDVPAGLFRNGTSRRGGVRGPGFWRTDFALFKNTRISERFTTQFRLESLNTFNHTNPNCCGSLALGSGSFARILGTRDARIVQLGMKLNF